LAESMIAEVFASKSPAFTISTRVAPICRLVLSDTPSPLSSQNAHVHLRGGPQNMQL
jgi:hypothetical protein